MAPSDARLQRGFATVLLLTLALALTSALPSPALGAADVRIDAALVALRSRDHQRARELLTPLATSGVAEAQYLLGTLYLRGLGADKDPAAAFTWFKQAAAQGDAKAQYELALLYEKGNGVPQDLGQAAHWYQQAVAGGYSRAKAGQQRLQALVATGGDGDIFTLISTDQPELVANWLQQHPEDAVNRANPQGLTPLHHAASKNRAELVRLLLAADAAVDKPDGLGRTALHIAVANGSSAICDQLLAAHANVNAADRQGATPLHVAARAGTTALASKLLAGGANANAAARNGDHPLDLVSEQNAALTTLLRSRGAVASATAKAGKSAAPKHALADRHPEKQTDSLYTGWPALNVAAWRGQDDVVKTLLARRPTLDSLDPGGHTPLSRAALQGYPKVVDLLLKAGADPDPPLADGHSPLWLAVNNGQADCVQLLLEKSTLISRSPPQALVLLTLAIDKDRESLALAILHRIPATKETFGDGTLLARAASRSQSELATALLARGLDANVRDEQGASVLWWAVRNNQSKLVDALLSAGANPNLADADGTTPLMVAARAGQLELATALLNRGAKIDAANALGNTALILAAEGGHLATVNHLINGGADVETRNLASLTALMAAAQGDHLPVVKRLIEGGANPRRRNSAGKSVAELAQEAKAQTVVEYLERDHKGKLLW